MKFYWLLLAILGVWRITHLLNAEDGPWNLLVRFRRAIGDGVLGQLLDCFYCLSLWIAIPFAWVVGQSWKERLLLWPALSGAAILLERATAPPAQVAAPAYFEEPEGDYDVRMHKNEPDEIGAERFIRESAHIGK